MNPDFHSAAHRHWNDAEFLHCDSRLGNAYQLYGLAAECALKAVMQGLGMQLGDKGRPQEPGHKVHIDKLWQAFFTFCSGRNDARYANMLDPTDTTLQSWDLSLRYAADAVFDPEITRMLHSKVEITIHVLTQARLDGIIS